MAEMRAWTPVGDDEAAARAVARDLLTEKVNGAEHGPITVAVEQGTPASWDDPSMVAVARCDVS